MIRREDHTGPVCVHQDGFWHFTLEGAQDEPKTAMDTVNRMLSMGHGFEGWHHPAEAIVELVHDAADEASKLHRDHSHEGGMFDGSRAGTPDDFITIETTRMSRFLNWLWQMANSDVGGYQYWKPRIDKVTAVLELLKQERSEKIAKTAYQPWAPA